MTDRKANPKNDGHDLERQIAAQVKRERKARLRQRIAQVVADKRKGKIR